MNPSEFIPAIAKIRDSIPADIMARWKSSWNAMNEATEPTTESLKPGMLGLSQRSINHIVRKLIKKPVYKEKLCGDDYLTTFRMADSKLMAYEPKYPNGRLVVNHDYMRILQNSNEYIVLTPKGWICKLSSELLPNMPPAEAYDFACAIGTHLRNLERPASVMGVAMVLYYIHQLGVKILAADGPYFKVMATNKDDDELDTALVEEAVKVYVTMMN